MNYRTEISIPNSHIQINHNHGILTIGSCFAENISQHLKYYRFDALENPFGVLYNPVSIYQAIKLIFNNKTFEPDDLIYHDSEWHSFYHHSDFSHHDINVCLQRINSQLEAVRLYLKNCNCVIITYGTSYVYKYKSNGIIVSNCHKLPANQFTHYRLTSADTAEYIQSSWELLKQLNPKLNCIFSISPVRHWKDGAVDNQISKSALLLALHETIKEKSDCSYFPAYEIMMDDLRDYRFYDADLVHPNQIAKDYIWEKFSQCYFTETCLGTLKDIKKLAQARLHRPRNIYSEKHRRFVKDQLQLIDQLKKKYPYLKLEDDYNYFMRQKLDNGNFSTHPLNPPLFKK